MLRFNIFTHLSPILESVYTEKDSEVNKYQHYNHLASKQLDVWGDNKTNTCIVIGKALQRKYSRKILIVNSCILITTNLRFC